MKRRTFLKGTVVTAGAVVIGCGDDDGTDTTGGTTDGTDTGTDTGTDDGLEDGTAYFPQSVASGDPTPATVILWTRVWDADDTGDLALELQVSIDEAFAELVPLSDAASNLTAAADDDHCVKVRLTELAAGSIYYYRFIYKSGDTSYVSRTGRTKTAPAADADAKVRFAFVSCQDFNGHYYNSYNRLLREDDIDFFVHLGDYIYETTGNPSFQDTHPDRRIKLTDTAGAIDFGGYYAAKSLDNYREVYQQYRGDEYLQRMHEQFAMVAVWDDHEFSDDCHGITATYEGGRVDEADLARRKSASQAWFEHMPVDYMGDPDFKYDPEVEFPDDIKIWRDLGFGKHMHLVMTDLRTRRTDHLIPEDAFPGTVMATQEDLMESFGEITDEAGEYVNIDDFEGGKYADLLKAGAEAGEYPESDVTSDISVAYINGHVAKANEGKDEADWIAAIEPDADRKRGLSYSDLGKRGKFGGVGSRYLLNKDGVDPASKVLWDKSGGESEVMMGKVQREWFLSTMQGSDKTWKVWGSEFCLTQLVVDLRAATQFGSLAKRFYITGDDWTGMPNRRNEILEALGDLENVVAITGDIHSFFAGTPKSRGDNTKGIIELVTAGAASNSLSTLLLRTAKSDPSLPPEATALAFAIQSVLTDKYSKPNPDLAHANCSAQGFTIVEVDGAALTATMWAIPETGPDGSKWVEMDFGDGVMDKFETTRWQVKAGENALYKEVDGAFKKWDAAAWDFV